MKRIAELAPYGLKWSQPKALARRYELRAAGELVGTLEWASMFGTLATGRSDDGCWTFKRVGFWRGTATIRECDREVDLAVFTNNTWSEGGTLELKGGRSFQATTNLWRTKLEITGEAQNPLVRFDYGGVFHRSADVHVSPFATESAELPLLVLFGWYLIIMLDDDTAAIVAATS